ncbi:lysophospholipid acyltransferase family protein [Salimicrobium sp. PL1-032A]|uniref:lysophospholipid acyltransferase family protein n=1 Tax=Salimicrobium sp. PL1-032A TaxID=3095364 RepID=UPI003261B60E
MKLYKFARSVVAAALYPLYRIDVKGKSNIPKNGPVIICSNHISNLDPPVVGITSPRTIHFMAKEELFQKRGIGALLRNIHAFPIKRGMRDRNALRNGLDILKQGEVLGLFPEGSRQKTGEIGEGLTGAGFFALRSQAVVVPCAIIGPYKLGKRLKVAYGTPIDLTEFRENKVSAKEVTDHIMESIRQLHKFHQE